MRRIQGSNLLELALIGFRNQRITVLPILQPVYFTLFFLFPYQKIYNIPRCTCSSVGLERSPPKGKAVRSNRTRCTSLFHAKLVKYTLLRRSRIVVHSTRLESVQAQAYVGSNPTSSAIKSGCLVQADFLLPCGESNRRRQARNDLAESRSEASQQARPKTSTPVSHRNNTIFSKC